MTVTPIPERIADKSQQVLDLLSELTGRLRDAEGERDTIREDITFLKEEMETLFRGQETIKKLLETSDSAAVSSADYTSLTTVIDSAQRRIEGLEDTVDRQTSEFLSILKRIEGQFESYDTENKAHLARVSAFEKILEQYTQERDKLSRRVDELDFHLLGKTVPIPTRIIPDDEAIPSSLSSDLSAQQHATGSPLSSISDQEKRFSGFRIWGPKADHPPFITEEKKEPAGDTDRIWSTSPDLPGRILSYVAYGCFVVLLLGLGYGVLQSIFTLPPEVRHVSQELKAEMVLPKTDTSARSLATPRAETENTPSSKTEEAGIFSSAVRAQIDAQMVAAKAEEDKSSQALLNTPLTSQEELLKTDTAIPVTVQNLYDQAMKGQAKAQHDLAALYATGANGVSIDYPRAAVWFHAAAKQGMANARYNLGVLYQQGLGVEKDMTKALGWYRAAALLDHPEAKYNLGIAAAEGIGMNYNPGMAAAYFESAAKSGVVEAAYNLGVLLENGQIDEPRPYEALFWYEMALAGGHEPADKNISRILDAQSLTKQKWDTLFGKMKGQRPDLKSLIQSRTGE